MIGETHSTPGHEDSRAVTPERLLRLCNGHQVSALLSVGATHQIFTRIDEGARTVEEIAARAEISIRGAQALLDGLASLGVVRREAGRYTNAEDTARFLVEGKPSSMTPLARSSFRSMPEVSGLVRAVQTGEPLDVTRAAVDDPYWLDLVPVIGRLGTPVARAIAVGAGIAGARRPSILDVGGGSGLYTLICLGESPEATGLQIDWPSVNRIARHLAAERRLGDRFQTIDGDYHTTSFGDEEHDLVIYAHIAHSEPPRENVALFQRIRRALKPGGVLAISDFILDEDRRGTPFAGIFHTNMLLHTREGAVWRESDYRAWLGEAGFGTVSFAATETPATLVFAR